MVLRHSWEDKELPQGELICQHHTTSLYIPPSKLPSSVPLKRIKNPIHSSTGEKANRNMQTRGTSSMIFQAK
jgi:hypothetical protein